MPLTPLQREVLNKSCEISYHHNAPLYIALNKTDLVEPKIKLLDLSNTLSEWIWHKKIEMINKVARNGCLCNGIDGKPDTGAIAMGKRGVVYDFGTAERWNRRDSEISL